ncbi:catechol 2,3-dioxygenase-like lactoylglutathione lyase family enzyme [Maribacter vaceletii]|uniref:Catechol 2,3-dioxygenase-like lactoylglutathione lyase family enzyme n=1 Tax=Maribacter vaceletii TaxID=1206816 RepID=A0A495EF00_9FLAO|nr:VOC family protein [Maribacter vaceletii]RKR15249.1 catechol 2,3-dioxygenase-like lactoylglutathione lyase family enzyme [Maribacter vaceletii]
MPIQFKRATLLVADLKKSLSIYSDILGFSVNYIKKSEDDSYSYPVFNLPKNAQVTFCALDSPSQKRTFALTEVKEYKLPEPKGPRMAVLVLQVDDLKKMISNIASLGLETLDFLKDTTDGESYLEQAFIDFDGHLILLYEILKE